MRPARIYPWRKMHRSRAPSIAPDTFFVAQSWADFIITTSGFRFSVHTGAQLGCQPNHVSAPANAVVNRRWREPFASLTVDQRKKGPFSRTGFSISVRTPANRRRYQTFTFFPSHRAVNSV